MTLLYMDGFDLSPVDATYMQLRGWTGNQLTSGTGRVSGRGLTSTWGGSAGLTSPNFGNKATIGVGFAHWRNGLPGSAYTMLSFYDSTGAVEQCALRINPDGSLTFTRGNNVATLGTTAPGLIVSTVWKYIEVLVTIDDAAGSVDVRVDNSSVLSLTGVDTKNGTNAWVNQIRCWVTTNTSDIWDDMYILDTAGTINNALIGDCRIVPLRPTTDDAVQWSRSTGATNFGVVDDTQIDQADYIFTDVLGHKDQFGLADLPSTPASVHAVEIVASHLKTDAGVRTIRGFLNSSGTLANANPVASLLNTQGIHAQFWELDPNTAAPWSAAAVNALKAGVEVVT